MERKKQIEVEEKEVTRKDKELVATVRRPAEAESYRVETIAQGKRSAFEYDMFVLKEINCEVLLYLACHKCGTNKTSVVQDFVEENIIIS